MPGHGRVWASAAALAAVCLVPICRAGEDPVVREDCVGFNLDSVSVKFIEGDWKIVSGNQWLFDFGNQEQQARRALDIIYYYRMDATCYAGRPHAPMFYLLSSGQPPIGSMPGEQCEFFNLGGISLSQRGEFWSILSGTQVLFDFGNREKGAKQGMLAFRHYGFSYRCIVGSTGASFQYLRR